MDIPFDLTCWYINSRRVMELVGSKQVSGRLASAAHFGDSSHFMRRNAEQVILKEVITEWLLAAKPPSLGKLIVEDTLEPGKLFTHYSSYYCRGLREVRKAINKKNNPPMAEVYSKLESWSSKSLLSCKYHHEHLTSQSSWSELTGQRRLIVVGLIKDLKDNDILALPYVIAYIIDRPALTDRCTLYWHNQLEVHVDSIDSFNRVKDIRTQLRKKDLQKLKDIPESAIKKAFAEIINEPTIPKDWGGEPSDLFSSNVRLDGKRISTAFVFKGPSKFKPMTLAELGKNGDQLIRLFSEPAELLILQHCHEITTPVRTNMRALAQQVGNPRLCCVIDGYDTLRILEAYNKCGFGDSSVRQKIN